MAKSERSSSSFEPFPYAPRRRELKNSDEGTEVKWGVTKSFPAEDIRGAVQGPVHWLNLVSLLTFNLNLCQYGSIASFSAPEALDLVLYNEDE
jgi:hypothetical protein